MDLFTHMMVSYLLGQGCGLIVGGLTEPQLLFAVIAGIFPDFDVLTFPSWRWVPRLRHHGVTHSLLFPVANAFALSFIVYLVWGLDPLQFTPLGLLTGVFHVVSDLMTNFPVPLLAPASWRGYSFAVDAAVNPYTLFPSLALIALFWNLRASGFDYGAFRLMLLAVAIALVAHFSAKLGIKLALRRSHGGEAERVDAHPTLRYLTWYLMLTRSVDGAEVTEYQKLRIGWEGRRSLFFEVSAPEGWRPTQAALGAGRAPEPFQERDMSAEERRGAGLESDGGAPNELASDQERGQSAGGGPSQAPPTLTRDRAIALSFFKVKERTDVLGRDEEAAAVVSERPGGGWEIFWFRWWSAYMPPVKGLAVTVMPDGSCTTADASRVVEL